MLDKKGLAIFLIQLSLIAIDGFFLWFKILLPTSYYVLAALIAAMVAIQIILKSKYTYFSLLALLVILNTIYYISMNYQAIPFGDANWDYAVAHTFIENGQISTLSSTNLMAFYSGWPLLHSFAALTSQIAGIDVYYVSMIVPLILSVISFLFVTLIMKRLRFAFNLEIRFEYFALLIYICCAEALAWQFQFVRQNLGIMLFFGILALLLEVATSKKITRTQIGLTMFLSVVLVMAHHYSSLILVFFLFGILFSHNILKIITRKPYDFLKVKLFKIFLMVSILLFLWWDSFGNVVWTNITWSLQRLVAIITGTSTVHYLPTVAASYPASLTPLWATSALAIRDILIYSIALLGFFILIRRKSKSHADFFVLVSLIAFAIIFLVNNFVFRVEILRLFELAVPFIAALGGLFAVKLYGKIGSVSKKILVIVLVFLLVPTAFVGLWGHSYAPIHLYDPSVNFEDVGERSPNFDRIADFVNGYINVTNYRLFLTDDTAPLIRLLNPPVYSNILRVDADSTNLFPSYRISNKTVLLYPSGTMLAFEFRDMNLYYYYSRQYSPVPNPSDAKVTSEQLTGYLNNNSSRIFDDGQYRIWTK